VHRPAYLFSSGSIHVRRMGHPPVSIDIPDDFLYTRDIFPSGGIPP
jgi:hypothetical protein